jgi:hypothetical protein
MNSKYINAMVVTKKEYFEVKLDLENKVEDLKFQIEKYLGLNLMFYYIFHNNLNLLDDYNNKPISNIVRPGDEYIFYVVNRDDYNEMIKAAGILKCHHHPFSLAYLFCEQCKELVCDICKEGRHSGHPKISDQSLVLDSYYMVLQQYEKKVKHLFGKKDINNDLDNTCTTMESKLEEFKARKRKEVIYLSEEVKLLVDKMRDIELERLGNICEAGFNKISTYQEDAKEVYRMFKKCQDALSNRKSNVIYYSEMSEKNKIDYLINLQNFNIDIISKANKIEDVLEKVTRPDDYDIANLIEKNTDYTYEVSLIKVKNILDKLVVKLLNKKDNENHTKHLNRMESQIKTFIHSKKSNLLNMSANKQTCIVQPIDKTLLMNVYDIEKNKINTKAIYFSKDAKHTKILPEIPLYSRAIKILGKLYITGGEIDGHLLNTVIEVDVNRCEAIMKKGMDHRRSGHTVVNISNIQMIVISGSYLETSCETYEIQTDTWMPLAHVSESRVGPSAFVYNCETIYLFFGKRWDAVLRRWVFIETIERLNLFEKMPKWKTVYFKSTSASALRQRAFSTFISFTHNKVYIIGGQVVEDGKLAMTTDCLDIDMEGHIIGSCELGIPRPCSFLETNFYYYNGNAIQFDNEGSVLIYSSIYDELWAFDV